MSIGYTLRAEYSDSYRGGVFATSAGDFDVAEELETGGGTITVDSANHELALILDENPALKRVAAPEGADPITSYDRMGASDLRAALRGRDLPTGGRVDELRTRLENSDAGIVVDPAGLDAQTGDDTPPATTGQEA